MLRCTRQPSGAEADNENIWLERRSREYFCPFAESGLEAARVIHADRNALTVMSAGGECRAVVAGCLDENGQTGRPVAGDWVAVDRSADTVVVRAIVPRRGELTRRRPGGAEQSQCVAANVDLALIVEAVDRGPNARRIERGISLAYRWGNPARRAHQGRP